MQQIATIDGGLINDGQAAEYAMTWHRHAHVRWEYTLQVANVMVIVLWILWCQGANDERIKT